jgi:dihydropteroate synthase
LLTNSGPLVMGVLNVTPDSFSDGGKYLLTEQALSRALRMVDEGVDVIDIGGESSRPGAQPISIQQEIDRVMPVIEAIQQVSAVSISVDTIKPEVMQAALERKVWMINDINALQAPGAIEVVSKTDCQICLMHKQGVPQTMQDNPQYAEPIVEVINQFFRHRVKDCESKGIARNRLWLDPGFGFGKTPQHNLSLLKQMDSFLVHQLPLMIGVSRKSTLGQVINQPVDKRIYAGIAAALYAIQRGVKMIRTHDVQATKEAILVWQAIESA